MKLGINISGCFSLCRIDCAFRFAGAIRKDEECHDKESTRQKEELLRMAENDVGGKKHNPKYELAAKKVKRQPENILSCSKYECIC